MIRKVFYLIIFAVFFDGCSGEKERNLVSITGSTMGTTYSVKIVATYSDAGKTNENFKSEIDSILQEVNRQMSIYIPTSEISGFNSSVSSGWKDISYDFAFVTGETKKLGELTDGALDLTIGPLVNIWGFGPDFKPRTIPSNSDIETAKRNTGLTNIEVTLIPPRIMKKNPAIYCDLSATAKGYGVDKIAVYLIQTNYQEFLVEIGGEVRVQGKNHLNEPWKIGISTPDATGNIQKIIALENMAMATSGDYWNYFEENGVRYSHTIDPRTGRPITHKLASVTVIHQSCMIADGLATAINVMGPETGLKFAEQQKLPVYLIVRDGEGFITKSTESFNYILKNERMH